MNPSLPKSSFYPFRTIIRPLAAPDWSRNGGGWSPGWERVLEFLERLVDEPLTWGMPDVSPWRLLTSERADDVARRCLQADRALGDATENDMILQIMPVLAAARPYRCGDAKRDAVINLRAVLYAGAFVARNRHRERCKNCPLSGAWCGGGIYCARHAVEHFFMSRPALRDPVKADGQLRDMAAWSRDDFRRLVLATSLSPSSCARFAHTRAIRS